MLSWTLMVLGSVLAGADEKTMRWDFEDATIGQLPGGWSAAKTGEGPGSIWKIVEDPSAPKGSKVLAQTSSEGPNPLFNVCVADATSIRNFDLSVSFKAISGKSDQGGGAFWRYRDANNYYIAQNESTGKQPAGIQSGRR